MLGGIDELMQEALTKTIKNDIIQELPLGDVTVHLPPIHVTAKACDNISICESWKLQKQHICVTKLLYQNMFACLHLTALHCEKA
jgi:hypothetical protein